MHVLINGFLALLFSLVKPSFHFSFHFGGNFKIERQTFNFYSNNEGSIVGYAVADPYFIFCSKF